MCTGLFARHVQQKLLPRPADTAAVRAAHIDARLLHDSRRLSRYERSIRAVAAGELTIIANHHHLPFTGKVGKRGTRKAKRIKV
jgi:hypothetical protein